MGSEKDEEKEEEHHQIAFTACQRQGYILQIFCHLTTTIKLGTGN